MPPQTPARGWRRWLRPETYNFEARTPVQRLAKRVIISVIGTSVVLLGIILIFTPGPAIVVIPAGLAILALEFAWARRWLRRLKAYARLASRKAKRKTGPKTRFAHAPLHAEAADSHRSSASQDRPFNR
jgi:uncharacterized protein (TIGR02611 family)